MGWYGTWDIKYNGKDPELFQNLSKVLIPNFKERFLVSEDGDSLDCQESLSWNSADLDLKKITSYLHEGDSLEVEIYGETHPYDENDEKLESEQMIFKKENGEVIIKQEYVDEDRYRDDISQLKEIFDEYPDEYAEWVKQELMENGKLKHNIRAVYEAVVDEYAGANKERFMNIENDEINQQTNDFNDFLKDAHDQADKINQQAQKIIDNVISEKSIKNMDFKKRIELTKQGIHLGQLINDKDPFVRCEVARQGYGLEQLVNDKSPIVRYEVAKQGYGLEQLAKDEFTSIRVEVARQGYGLEQLINDEDYLVRVAVAEQGYGLDQLVNDENPNVREIAEQKLQDQIKEETDIDNFDDFLKEAHDQADKINQQAQNKNISKDIDKDYER